jgi:periplasmic divalent cation tolerance protein
MKSNFVIVLVTTRNSEEAAKIATALVEEKLAACCNIVDQIRSVYFWDGKVCDESESLIVIKTKHSNFKKLEKRIRSLHSYDVPEIVALPVVQTSRAYWKWVKKNSAG